MEKDHPSLTKTCSICGEVKPLAAFLQMSGSASTEYGSVCADCRKKGADKPRVPESDGSERSSSGVIIDSKSKMQADIDKREQYEQTEEEYYEEREEAEIEQDQTEDKKEQTAASEKKHRQTFLDHSLLSGKKPAGNTGEARWRTDQTAQQAAIETAASLEKTTKEELQEKGVEQTEGESLGFGLKEKHKGVAFKEGIAFRQGTAFQAFRTRLGKAPEQGAPPSETLSEAVEKHWGPGGRKK